MSTGSFVLYFNLTFWLILITVTNGHPCSCINSSSNFCALFAPIVLANLISKLNCDLTFEKTATSLSIGKSDSILTINFAPLSVLVHSGAITECEQTRIDWTRSMLAFLCFRFVTAEFERISKDWTCLCWPVALLLELPIYYWVCWCWSLSILE